MPATLDHTIEQEYLALVHTFPLLSIRDDAHVADALTVIDQLVEQPTRSAAQEAYLEALTDLVEVYENAHVAIPPISGVEALRYLMIENGLTQNALTPFFGSPSIVSEVLSGKRHLTLRHITKLATYFGLPADTFI